MKSPSAKLFRFASDRQLVEDDEASRADDEVDALLSEVAGSDAAPRPPDEPGVDLDEAYAARDAAVAGVNPMAGGGDAPPPPPSPSRSPPRPYEADALFAEAAPSPPPLPENLERL